MTAAAAAKAATSSGPSSLVVVCLARLFFLSSRVSAPYLWVFSFFVPLQIGHVYDGVDPGCWLSPCRWFRTGVGRPPVTAAGIDAAFATDTRSLSTRFFFVRSCLCLSFSLLLSSLSCLSGGVPCVVWACGAAGRRLHGWVHQGGTLWGIGLARVAAFLVTVCGRGGWYFWVRRRGSGGAAALRGGLWFSVRAL